MKRYILILGMAFGVISFASAQQKMPTAGEMATKSVDTLAKRLKLNPTQKNIIYNYTFDMCKAQLEMSKKQQTGAYNEDDISRFYRLQNETSTNIKNVLKGDQLTEYDKFMEEQLRGGNKKKKKKKGKDDEEEVVTGISGLKLPPAGTNPNP